jgi:sec-independent protein translocase protein TatB
LYLLILESIGTSELILIGIIALIVFGPRKLPQMAKTIGKTMADFRRTTNDFKSTWEREAEFYKEEKVITPQSVSSPGRLVESEKTIAKTTNREQSQIQAPAIKEVEQEKIDQVFSDIKSQNTGESETEKSNLKKAQTDKRDWL